ncbi:MAG: hypothetical protein K9J42_07390, partial [Sulfuritalea sp.]|nr:hypothetical protein [Sulfuritalea sp.]
CVINSELNPDLSAQTSVRTFDFSTVTHHYLQHNKHLHLSVVWFLKSMLQCTAKQREGAHYTVRIRLVNSFDGLFCRLHETDEKH